MANSYTKYPKAFIPDTECVLAHMPMSGNNKDILIGTSASAYESIVMGNKVSSESDFSYQRVDSVIRYRGSYEDILDSGANYVAWKNEKFGGKVFYAYITRLEYKNPNVTWIHIRLDVINTFIYDSLNLGTQYVKRMTARSDNLYEHLTDEGINVEDGGYVYSNGQSTDIGEFVTAVAYTNKPLADSTRYAEYDGIIGNTIIGIATTPENFQSMLSSIGWDPNVKLNSCYTIPKFAVGYDVQPGELLSGQSAMDVIYNITFPSPTTPFSGYESSYVPHNWKLYNMPFFMLNISNGLDTSMDIGFEFCESNVAQVHLTSTLLQPVTATARVEKYQGGNTNGPSITLAEYPVISASDDNQGEFLVGAALTGMTNAMVKGMQISAVTKGGVSSYNNLKENVANQNPMYAGAIQNGTVTTPSLERGKQVIRSGSERQLENIVKPNNSANALEVAMNLATINAISNVKGSNQNGRVGTIDPVTFKNAVRLLFQYKHLRPDLAEKIDRYFSLYGYTFEQPMEVNLSDKRSLFDYYQLSDCHIKTNIPSDYRMEMEEIFNNGVRLWYDQDKFCDYSSANLAANSLH